MHRIKLAVLTIESFKIDPTIDESLFQR